MYRCKKFTALTMSLPTKYVKGNMEIDKQKAEEILISAFERGIRSFAAAPQYLMWQCEEFVGNCLRNVREEVTLSTNFAYFDPRLPKEKPVAFSLERSLKALQTEYIDCYYFYGHALEVEQLQEAKKARDAGKIKHIGIMLEPHILQHAKDILEKALPIADTVMAYFVPTIPGQLELFSGLNAKGIRIVAAGLLDIGQESLPASLLEGMEGMESISATELAARYFLQQELFDQIIFILKDKDYLELICDCEKSADKYSLNQLQPFFQAAEPDAGKPGIICSSCGYCMPCPKGINIPKLFNMFAYYDQYGMRESAAAAFLNYQEQLGDRIENICSNCGICEKRCLHRTPIISRLRALESFMDHVAVRSSIL